MIIDYSWVLGIWIGPRLCIYHRHVRFEEPGSSRFWLLFNGIKVWGSVWIDVCCWYSSRSYHNLVVRIRSHCDFNVLIGVIFLGRWGIFSEEWGGHCVTSSTSILTHIILQTILTFKLLLLLGILEELDWVIAVSSVHHCCLGHFHHTTCSYCCSCCNSVWRVHASSYGASSLLEVRVLT